MTASFSNKATLVGNGSNVPRLSLILFPPQLQNNDKSKYLARFILVRQVPVWFLKLGILRMHVVWASGQRTRFCGMCCALICCCLLGNAHPNPLSCLSICADPLSMLRMLCPAHADTRSPPALAGRIPTYIRLRPAVCPSQTASQFLRAQLSSCPSPSSEHSLNPCLHCLQGKAQLWSHLMVPPLPPAKLASLLLPQAHWLLACLCNL